MFNNVDAPGNRHNRRAVAKIQRLQGSKSRKDAAQERRDRRAAKRRILMFKMPEGGVSMTTPDGAYMWGGNPEVEGKYQVIVIGTPKGPPNQYRDALAAWTDKALRVVSAEPLPLPAPRPGLVIDDRAFLSIILEPEA